MPKLDGGIPPDPSTRCWKRSSSQWWSPNVGECIKHKKCRRVYKTQKCRRAWSFLKVRSLFSPRKRHRELFLVVSCGEVWEGGNLRNEILPTSFLTIIPSSFSITCSCKMWYSKKKSHSCRHRHSCKMRQSACSELSLHAADGW